MVKRVPSQTGLNPQQFADALWRERLEAARRFLPRSCALAAIGLLLFSALDFSTDPENFFHALHWRLGGASVLALMAYVTRFRMPRAAFEYFILIAPAALIWSIVLASLELREGPMRYAGGIALMICLSAAWCVRKRVFFAFNVVTLLLIAWATQGAELVAWQTVIVTSLLGTLCGVLFFDFLYRLSARNLRLRLELREESRTDGLTGLPNRRAFLERGADYLQRAKRKGTALGLLLIDADHFKQVNDQHGHDVGDAVLQALASAIANSIGETAPCCRLGGEEFAVLLDIDKAGLFHEIADSLVRDVRAFDWNAENLPRMTISVGAVFANFPNDWSTLMHQADHNLYQAKQRGRDQAVYSME